MRYLILSIACLLFVSISQAKIIYVDDDANGLKNGSSWKNAYNYLQDALADANSSPKTVEIRVAQGIYRPDETSSEPNGTGDRSASFQLINGVSLNGGYAGCTEPDPNTRDINLYETVLNGDLSCNDIVEINEPLRFHVSRQDNSYHVVMAINTDANAVLDGFTISRGYAYRHPSCGGGIYNRLSNPTVMNCIFRENQAGDGGGMYNQGASPTVMNCLFYYNIARWHGGGVKNYYDESTNTPSGPSFTNCAFISNCAQLGGLGGGMNNHFSSSTLTNCIFIGNSTSYQGGAISNFVVSDMTLINCTIANNYGGTSGIYSTSSHINIINCILWGNKNNSDVNESTQISNNGGGTWDINYSCIQGWTGIYGGTANTGADPCFILPNDCYLKPNSSLVDAGDNTAVPPGIVTDIDGCTRFYDVLDTNDTGNGTPPIIDMGAYEYEDSLRLAVSPLELQFSGFVGYPNPETQVLQICRVGTGILNWSISCDSNWIEVEPSTGISTGDINEVNVSVDISGLSPGKYNCDLVIRDPNAVNNWRMVRVKLDLPTVCVGDFNIDGNVDLLDLDFLSDHWLNESCSESNNWCSGCDLDFDKIVNFDDYSILTDYYHHKCYGP